MKQRDKWRKGSERGRRVVPLHTNLVAVLVLDSPPDSLIFFSRVRDGHLGDNSSEILLAEALSDLASHVDIGCFRGAGVYLHVDRSKATKSIKKVENSEIHEDNMYS